ncbi:MAG: hypothetical protein DCC46_04315 [Armatimonadetes bacterium]|nr:MAG: hypothetical protein DCC46_04315 [Armatimonadota bacterium]
MIDLALEPLNHVLTLVNLGVPPIQVFAVALDPFLMLLFLHLADPLADALELFPKLLAVGSPHWLRLPECVADLLRVGPELLQVRTSKEVSDIVEIVGVLQMIYCVPHSISILV